MSKYLVTGGAGFIGSHIVERLLKEGNFVRVLDNFSSGKEENLGFINNSKSGAENFELIRGDIRDFLVCRKALENVDFVLHQAALRSVPKSFENPSAYNEVNINGTLNMLKAASEAGVKRFVFASSSSIYGDTEKLPAKETDAPHPISPYALTKLCGEYYCRIYSQVYNLPAVCLRYFNVFGPRQALDDEYAVVIPKFIHCISNGQSPPIYGTGRQSRDFTYIDNVVEANLLALNLNGPKFAVFNIANGKGHTILELASILNKIMGKQALPTYLPSRKGDVFKTLADIKEAKKFLGYKPSVGFEEGLRRIIL